jgi:hypothetical protein
MQTYYRYPLPALLLVMLLSVATDSYGQSAPSAAIQVTATVVTPIGIVSCPEQSDDYLAKTPGLFVLCPTEAHVLVTVDDVDRPVHSRLLSDAFISIYNESGQPALRVLDCRRLTSLISSRSTVVVTVIVVEN